MRLTNSAILALLLLSATFCANAERENRWIKIEGGSWDPSAKIVIRLKERIESVVGAQAKAEGRKLQEWTSYAFQYQGQERRGRRFVFVNAFCSSGERQLSKQMVLVLDGGTCFFNLKYDAEENRFFELLINGEA
jgi:hypothetical protein